MFKCVVGTLCRLRAAEFLSYHPLLPKVVPQIFQKHGIGWCHFCLGFLLLLFNEHHPFSFSNIKLNLIKQNIKPLQVFIWNIVYAYLLGSKIIHIWKDIMMQFRNMSSELMAVLDVLLPHV